MLLFYDIIRVLDRDIYSIDILLDKENYENILIYKISYKTLTGAKPFGVKLDEIDRLIKIYDRIKF